MITFRLWQIAGWTMLHYFWVGAVLGTAALAVRPKLRSASASVRYLFALGSLLLSPEARCAAHRWYVRKWFLPWPSGR